MTWMLNQGLQKLGVEVHDLTLESLESERFDLLHIHFFEHYTEYRNPFRVLKRVRGLLAGIDKHRAAGGKLVYTAHDVIGHDVPWRSIERWFLDRYMSKVDGVIFVSEASIKMVRDRFPQLTSNQTIIPLSDYGDWYPDTISRQDARAKFGIADDELVITHVGLVKRYKNVSQLVKAFTETPGKYRLLLAGRVIPDELRDEIDNLCKADPRIIWKPGHIDDAEMQNYYRAADLAIFPYRAILNSGSAMLALTFGLPIVVPQLGSMPELQKLISPDWVHLQSDEINSKVLRESLDWLENTNRSEKPPMDALTVDAIAQRHFEFYQKVKSG